MGDRANVCVRDGKEKVYLYTHWGGCEFLKKVHTSMSKKVQWDDPPYLVEILHKDIGFSGIWAHADDNEHPIIVIDCEDQRIYLEDPEKHEANGHNERYCYTYSWTFNEFVLRRYESIEKYYLQ